MKINKLLGNKVLLKKLDKKTPTGIVVPDSAEKLDEIKFGEVAMLGEDVETSWGAGDKVMFQFGFEKLKVGDEELLIGNVDSIIAVVDEI